MLRETIEWRKKFEMHKLHTEFKDTIALENATGKMYVRGFDLEGNPLIYMKPVNENTKNHDGNIKHLVYTMERAVACMDAKGSGATKLSLVIDYDGYTMSHAPTMKTSTETLNILQNHYPERLKCAYCIRAPFVFYAFFKMVSPFIDPVTKKKISMIKNAELGTAGCQLSKEIDAALLEKSVGGQDSRPFDSKQYLAAPFDQDFTTTLNLLAAGKAAVAKGGDVPAEKALVEAVAAVAITTAAAEEPEATASDVEGPPAAAEEPEALASAEDEFEALINAAVEEEPQAAAEEENEAAASAADEPEASSSAVEEAEA